jgi:hypothetical protein
LATFHVDKPAFISTEPSKVWYRVVTEAVFHLDKPVPTNFDAPLKVLLSVVTLSMFHSRKSAVIFCEL